MSGAEVAIPVYERLREEARRSGRLRDSLLVGVSTRQDARVLPEMAGTVGIRKSRVSRRFTEASRTTLEKLGKRRLEGFNLLAIDLDGIVIDGSKALRSALGELFGSRAMVQRCRVHYADDALLSVKRLPAAD